MMGKVDTITPAEGLFLLESEACSKPGKLPGFSSLKRASIKRSKTLNLTTWVLKT